MVKLASLSRGIDGNLFGAARGVLHEDRNRRRPLAPLVESILHEHRDGLTGTQLLAALDQRGRTVKGRNLWQTLIRLRRRGRVVSRPGKPWPVYLSGIISR